MAPDIKRLTIIPGDGAVIVNEGESLIGLDLSFIPAEVHAVQWYGTWGEVEPNFVPGEPLPPNRRIESLDDYAPAIDLYFNTLEANKAKAAENSKAHEPPKLTPAQITERTMYHANTDLWKASVFDVPLVKDNITPDSLYALKEWADNMIGIMTKAQKILMDQTGEAYEPDPWPPFPSLNPAPKAGEEFTIYFSEPPKAK